MTAKSAREGKRLMRLIFDYRLMQNRKSAKKCRLKKKAEFGQMRGDVMKLQEENKNLKEKVSTPTFNPLGRQSII